MELNKKMIILDTETTGLGADDEVIEIGIIDVEGNTLFSHLIKTRKFIPTRASLIHGIYNSTLRNEHYINDYKDELKEILKDKVIVGYNIEFDIKMLKQTFDKYGLGEEFKDCLNESIDAMKEFGDYIGFPSTRGLGFKLSEASKLMNINVIQDHRATSDCLLTLELIKAMNKEEKCNLTIPEIISAIPEWKAKKILNYDLRVGRYSN